MSRQRIDMLRYIAHEYELQEVAYRLKRHGYRGAICGPTGCGKTIMLQALGDELMGHGLTPLPLFIDPQRARALPRDWQRTIQKARHTDALLLDGYDLLPYWARAWVWLASMRAGAVVVTAEKDVRFKTLARPKPSQALLQKLIDQLAPQSTHTLDCAAIYDQANGNLREALHLASDLFADSASPAKPSKGRGKDKGNGKNISAA